jgi:hypothetical protein
MELNFGINTPHSKEVDTLYKLAYQCASSNTRVHCNVCPTCTYNIDRYGWDPKQIQLLKARALMDYQLAIANKKAAKEGYIKVEASIVIVVLIAVLFLFIGVGVINAEEQRIPQTIDEATALVKINLRDVNFDKQINCIDYAVIFYELWPNSQIIWVHNASKRFSHLLNMVDGTYIEPQVRSGDPARLWSKEWPTATKEDRTAYWSWWATHKRWY